MKLQEICFCTLRELATYFLFTSSGFGSASSSFLVLGRASISLKNRKRNTEGGKTNDEEYVILKQKGRSGQVYYIRQVKKTPISFGDECTLEFHGEAGLMLRVLAKQTEQSQGLVFRSVQILDKNGKSQGIVGWDKELLYRIRRYISLVKYDGHEVPF